MICSISRSLIFLISDKGEISVGIFFKKASGDDSEIKQKQQFPLSKDHSRELSAYSFYKRLLLWDIPNIHKNRIV